MILRNTLGEIYKNRSDKISVRKRRDMPSSSILFSRKISVGVPTFHFYGKRNV
ncbi:hypothetical protein LSS_00275 [Leptospira santarosai serovar Shermani str. LT 821]|uniref:Uncharacterized protein n=1 Tax=Leptospira santarosai serovar Shermani str. LT 821 TaxID=758847 RepID=K8Y714_9LEPT|nr:hypothetical protein LSS_00275 [Leptospira santarosai serovar Shermani str. LT 821]EPG83142.1 hypothetical protein LEP1GSC048_1715 [Leptospira santarosai serovar Shermani str. 1342KT]